MTGKQHISQLLFGLNRGGFNYPGSMNVIIILTPTKTDMTMVNPHGLSNRRYIFNWLFFFSIVMLVCRGVTQLFQMDVLKTLFSWKKMFHQVFNSILHVLCRVQSANNCCSTDCLK